MFSIFYCFGPLVLVTSVYEGARWLVRRFNDKYMNHLNYRRNM